MKIFKVKDTKTGLYSTGGYHPSWTKQGKSWESLGSVTSHLRLYARGYSWSRKRGQNVQNQIPDTWVVVEIEVQESELSQKSALDFLKPKAKPAKKDPWA